MFNEIVIENFMSPTHQGQVAEPDITLELGNPACGDRVIVTLHVDEKHNITNPRFKAWGCATSLAMANVFCRHIDGKDLRTLSPMSPESISRLLGALDPSQRHCLDMLEDLFSQLSKAGKTGA
jgi:nitrogen fixation NifU-like protein